MQFGYGRRVNRPEFNALDPFPKNFFYSSIDTIGNPELKPEFINAYEIGYSSINNKIKINTSVYYHSIQDLILWDEGLVSDSLSLYSFGNYGNGTLVGAEFNIKFFPMSNWEMSLTANPFRYDIYADNNESEFYQGTIWNVVKTLTLDRIGKIEMNGSYHSPHTLSNGSIWPNGKINLDFAIQQTFFSKKMTVTLKVTDALNKEHYERIINKFDQNFRVQSHIDTFRKQDDPTLYLAFQYRFGTI
jgi:outer membrane receptor protein involved in Fe transport